MTQDYFYDHTWTQERIRLKLYGAQEKTGIYTRCRDSALRNPLVAGSSRAGRAGNASSSTLENGGLVRRRKKAA